MTKKYDWLEVVTKGWNSLLEDYDRFEENKRFWHEREEDIRSYLFHKLMLVLRKEHIPWWDAILRTEIDYQGKRLDLAIGWVENRYDVGIEVKPEVQRSKFINDIQKLKILIENRYLNTGVFIGFGTQLDESAREHIIQEWLKAAGVPLQEHPNEKSTCWKIKPIKPVRIENEVRNIESMMIVLRDPS